MTDDPDQAAQFRLISAVEAQQRLYDFLDAQAQNRGGGSVASDGEHEWFIIQGTTPSLQPPPWRLAVAAGLGVGVLARALAEVHSTLPAGVAAGVLLGDASAAFLGAVATFWLRWVQHRQRAGQVSLRAIPNDQQRVRGGTIFGEAVPRSGFGRKEAVEAVLIGAVFGLCGRRLCR